jgi:hypothetical protein
MLDSANRICEGKGVREQLAKVYGIRGHFQGVVDRFGVKAGWKHSLTTVMLRDVSDCTTKKVVTDHLWFVVHKQFASLNLAAGDVVSFDARVTKYLKGYQGRRNEDDYDRKPVEIDYRLSFPTKMKKIKSATTQITTPLPEQSAVIQCRASSQTDLKRWL